MTLLRSKTFWLAAVVLLAAGMTGVIDLPWPGADHPRHGPRHPGLNKQFNCRFMTVEVETTFTDAQLKRGVDRLPASMDAQLGTAGQVHETIHLIHNEQDVYRREFCAQPGSRLEAHILASEPVDALSCYFMSGPEDLADDETTAYGPRSVANYRRGAANQAATWCIGVVP